MLPKGSDKGVLEKLLLNFAKHPTFSKKLDANSFGINHYAGDVTYNIIGFLEKNKDT